MHYLKKYTKMVGRAVSTTFVVGCVYLWGLIATQTIIAHLPPEIELQSPHFEQILDRERNRAKICANKVVDVRFDNDKTRIPCVRKLYEGKYEIVLSPNGSNLYTLRHELYHIAEGHCDREKTGPYISRIFQDSLTSLFWDEPRAMIYGVTKLKL